AIRPYVVSLKKEYPNPFETNLDLEVDKEDEDKKENDKGKKNGKKNELDVEIDFDGIENRVLPFPVDFGGISSLSATDGKIFYLREDIAPNINKNHNGNGTDYDLCQFSFEENKEEIFHKDVTGYRLCHDSKKMLIADDDRLRLVYTESKPKTDADGTNKKDGWIDVGRAKLRINPVLEWKQMYREAWLLQKEHFWTKDMSKVEWKDVYNKYLPLLDRVKTRFEMSELLWEMQGELGTSHCYEVFGDYHRRPPHNPLARLGADLKWNEKEKAYEIKIIHQGDSWIKGDDSPMRSFGVDLSEGDMIFEADGVAFNNSNCIHRILENKGGDKVNLLIRKKGKRKKHYTCIPTLKSETGLLYRQWVEKNKDYVHKKSKGKLGYVHIPNMGANGYAEFYRHYIAECRYNGLVVDVRYNGGGHVSQHILKILAQKIVGFDQARWDGILPYPAYAINGPIVAVTNEEAGSDGDIFSHCFKLMKLGKLIGKRTWGGVVGINGQYMLKDGTLTTQPEFSFWFKDVGWKVENYGTDPDIEVEFTPEEWVKGVDPQLDRAIAETMKDMKKNPPLMPDLGKNRPVLKIPKLPKKK
ncbi:MAG: PDZ domain-containing protein, partial [Bacteriovoracaceae bacterium]|nr:PDZ domain-containing protein [Bacteriovoracaceae bacterium]